MKKLLLFLCVLASLQAAAQSFEGTITWSARQTPSDNSGRSATGVTWNVEGTSLGVTINGGMMNGMEMWYLDNNAKIMRIMRPEKMFVVVPAEALAVAAKSGKTGTFVKTSETAKILDYLCTKYAGEMSGGDGTSKVSIWTTTEIRDDQKTLAHNPDPMGNPMLPEGVSGVPLKIEKVTGNSTVVLEVTEVKPGKLAANFFQVPSDYKEMGK